MCTLNKIKVHDTVHLPVFVYIFPPQSIIIILFSSCIKCRFMQYDHQKPAMHM